jgi:hypothetical protein
MNREVHFAPRLAETAREKQPPASQGGMPGAAVTRKALLIRGLAIALIVAGIGYGFNRGTHDRREEERRAAIERAIATSGVGSQTAESGARPEMETGERP